MTDRGVAVDHSTVHRWTMKLLPMLEKAFRRCKRAVGKSGRMDETYVKVEGVRKYLHRAVDEEGNTVDFLPRARRNKAAVHRYFEKLIKLNVAFYHQPVLLSRFISYTYQSYFLGHLTLLRQSRWPPLRQSLSWNDWMWVVT